MPAPRNLDPSSSMLALFGSTLRQCREDKGWTQADLGKALSYTGPYVSMIEGAQRWPPPGFAERCDELLGTDGRLTALIPHLEREGHPPWFRNDVELEHRATSIKTYETLVVPGLLQCEEYAYALLNARPAQYRTDVDQLVAARVSRRSILTAPHPPSVWVLLDEAVLRRPFGGRTALRAQLALLLEVIEAEQVTIQVVPFSAESYPCVNGGLTLFAFADQPELGYVESYAGNFTLIQAPNQVAECNLAYDLTRAEALPPKATTDMIRAALKEI
ncbi:helix-turn-helix domain-containing protein [Catenulispora sp. NF23]|uniref:helix-turn-helix domain-containing protein n=1 Tax=Catenulispora pinistramenti TaxID=2705254 RepID=UPI001BA89236|nr:helix-turn-helix transcriptional regulator [Catenulispora pinistramenti]MBS2533268.1 helix-turn-helix domain-containing protein [Catenulispora pinistramenti]